MLNHLSLQKDFQGKNKLHNFHSANIVGVLKTRVAELLLYIIVMFLHSVISMCFDERFGHGTSI
jgi:hypothetical protein